MLPDHPHQMQQDPQSISCSFWVLEDVSQGLPNQGRRTVEFHVAADQHKA